MDGHEIFYDIVNVEKQKNKTPHDTYLKSEDDRGSLWESFTEPSGGTHMESEDSGSRGSEGFMEASGGTVTETKNSDASRLPEASRESSLTTVLKTEQGDGAPKLLSKNSIAQENAESKGSSEAFYVHEVCWSDRNYVTLNEQGVPTKKEDTATQLPKAVLNSVSGTQEVSSNANIAQTDAESKKNTAALKNESVGLQ